MKTRTHTNQKQKPHINIQSLKQKKRIPKKKSHFQHTQKKKKKSMLKKRIMQKLGEFEAFTLNYFGYGCIEFDKWPAAVFNLCGSPNYEEISFSFS